MGTKKTSKMKEKWVGSHGNFDDPALGSLQTPGSLPLGLCRTFVFQLRTHRSLHLVRGGLGFLGNFPPQENSVQIMGEL